MQKLIRAIVLTLFASLLVTPSHANELLDAPAAITGIFAAGETLEISYVGTRNTLQTASWYADGALIQSGATTLVLSNDEVGKEISARAIFTKNRMRKNVWLYSDIPVFESAPLNKGAMSWGDEYLTTPACFKPRPNNSLDVRIGWTVYMSCQPHNTSYGSPISTVYQWYRNNREIDGATNTLYRLQSADGEKIISALSTTTWPNGAQMVQLKALRSNPAPLTPLAAVSISGTVASGQLRAIATGTVAGTTFEYFWYRNFRLIQDQNSAMISTNSSNASDVFQVLVRATAPGQSPSALISNSVAGNSYSAPNLADLYRFTPSTVLDIDDLDVLFTASPSVSNSRLVAEKSRIASAANYWASIYTPVDLEIIYIDVADVNWIENYIEDRPTWNSKIPGGIRNWISQYGCGFALTFKTDAEIVVLQCLPGSAGELDAQVGPHEYAHVVQYGQSESTSLYIPGVPWMIEGFANYFGLMHGLGGTAPAMNYINLSLAQQASQFDASLQIPFGTFTNLKWFQAGSLPDTEILFSRNGNTWDWYFRGSLIAEWLTLNYSREQLLEWQNYSIASRTNDYPVDIENTKTKFAEIFGIQFDDLALQMAPYMALRSTQLLSSWRKAPAKVRKVLRSQAKVIASSRAPKSVCTVSAPLTATC